MTDYPEDVMKAAAEAVMNMGFETISTSHVLAAARAILAERERCAEIASSEYRSFNGGERRELYFVRGARDASTRIADAIRGGSNA